MLLPPNKTRKSSSLYKGYVNAKIPSKRNNTSATVHPNFHYTSAQVSYVNEFAALFPNEVVALSCDCKNKINVGTLAVSRYFQINSYFFQEDSPDYNDHDFPYPDAKLVPAGYMSLYSKQRRSRSFSPVKRGLSKRPTRRTRSQSPDLGHLGLKKATDRQGRQRIPWRRTGPLSVYVYPSRYIESVSSTHATYLFSLLLRIKNEEGKTAATIICDGGPDWQVDSTVNLISFGRLWKDLGYEFLLLCCYAPGHSRFNPIERVWVPLSRWLCGVTLPILLPDESCLHGFKASQTRIKRQRQKKSSM